MKKLLLSVSLLFLAAPVSAGFFGPSESKFGQILRELQGAFERDCRIDILDGETRVNGRKAQERGMTKETCTALQETIRELIKSQKNLTDNAE